MHSSMTCFLLCPYNTRILPPIKFRLKDLLKFTFTILFSTALFLVDFSVCLFSQLHTWEERANKNGLFLNGSWNELVKLNLSPSSPIMPFSPWKLLVQVFGFTVHLDIGIEIWHIRRRLKPVPTFFASFWGLQSYNLIFLNIINYQLSLYSIPLIP